MYVVVHGSHNWRRESNTIFVKTSFHLNTFNQLQIRFKTRFTDKNTMHRQYVNCFRDVATHIITVSKTLHLSNQNVLCGSELIIEHKTQTKLMFVLKV